MSSLLQRTQRIESSLPDDGHRHAFTQNVGAAIAAGVYSQWCENLGLAATRDRELVRRFAEIARSEYTALGIRAALHPTIDLATDARWARQFNTFGSSEETTTQFLESYLEGFQGAQLGPQSVACMAKHFPGGGAQKDGEDPHFCYGREQVYPGDNFEQHLAPFRRAVELGVSAMMPYYSLPQGLVRNGLPIEEVGFAFNRQIITGLLREEIGFDGVVCCDWAIINDQKTKGHHHQARAWGVEHLTPVERLAKALDAGVDQFGGEASPELVVEVVESGRIPESRIDVSVRRILRVKFQLGLFDNPFVDEEHAVGTVGCDEFRKAGFEAQCRSMTVLKNAGFRGSPALPCKPGVGLRVYAPQIPDSLLASYATPVSSPLEADIAILRLAAPWEPRSKYFLEDKYHAGSLAFQDDKLKEIISICETVPTIVDIYLDRPAVIPEIAAVATALVANFGAKHEALLEVVFGRVKPQGRLPFEMSRSMEAVRAASEDVAGTNDPLFPIGHGLDI